MQLGLPPLSSPLQTALITREATGRTKAEQ